MPIEAITDEPRPNTCHQCRASVIWCQLKSGGKYRPIALEVCAEGAGNYAFFPSLFTDGRAPIAEIVCNGTTYRAHEEHCTAALVPPAPSPRRTRPPAAYSAATFGKRK